MQKDKIWTGTFTLTLIINLLFYLVFYLLTVIMATVASTQFHASASIAGILSGIFVVGGFAGRLFAGYSVMRIGVKRLLFFGAIFYLITTLLYFAAPSLPILMVVRFFHGIGFGVAATTASTLAGLIVPIARRGVGIGYFALSITIASAFGPFLSITVYHAMNYNALRIIATAFILIALIGVFFLKVPEKYAKPSTEGKLPFKLSSFFEKTAMPISFIGFLIGVGYAGILSFLASYSASIGLVTAGSLFYLVYALFILGSRPFSGRLFDEKGDNFVLIPTFLFFSLGLAMTGLAANSFVLLAAAAFVGLGYGSFLPFGQAIAIRHASPERIGIATSSIYGLFDLGVGVGPFLLGAVQPTLGYRNLYFLSAVFLLFVALLYYFIHGRKAPKPSVEFEELNEKIEDELEEDLIEEEASEGL
ncbi:MFS transporter [Lactovum odontotermitis]